MFRTPAVWMWFYFRKYAVTNSIFLRRLSCEGGFWVEHLLLPSIHRHACWMCFQVENLSIFILKSKSWFNLYLWIIQPFWAWSPLFFWGKSPKEGKPLFGRVFPPPFVFLNYPGFKNTVPKGQTVYSIESVMLLWKSKHNIHRTP